MFGPSYVLIILAGFNYVMTSNFVSRSLNSLALMILELIFFQKLAYPIEMSQMQSNPSKWYSDQSEKKLWIAVWQGLKH